jgi:hypothetical protein
MITLKFVFLIISFLFCLISEADASPMYYTFQGTVTSINDGAGMIENAGIEISDPVTYTFLIDLEAGGTYETYDGTTVRVSDNSMFNYFYTDYVSGTALGKAEGGFYNNPSDVAEYNYGYEYNNRFHAGLLGGSLNNMLSISKFYSSVSEWSATTLGLSSTNEAFNSVGLRSVLLADLNLVEISATSPAHVSSQVQIPSTFLLAATGLGILGLVRMNQYGWFFRGLRP